jgi:hypothetical protein
MFLFVMPMISAIDTEIKIKTLPFHEVQVTIMKPMSPSFESWGNFQNYSDQYGDVSFIFSSNKYNFDLKVFIKKDNEKIMPPQKFLENFPAGEPIYLEIAPGGFQLLKNPANEINLSENITIEDEDRETEESQLTGAAVFGEDGLLSGGRLYYIIGGLLLLVVAFFIFRIMRKKIKLSKNPKEIKIKKLSELQAEQKEGVHSNQQIIEDAEKKIKEAQEDIRQIKSDDKIKEAKKKIIEDEKELMRLRSGKE